MPRRRGEEEEEEEEEEEKQEEEEESGEDHPMPGRTERHAEGLELELSFLHICERRVSGSGFRASQHVHADAHHAQRGLCQCAQRVLRSLRGDFGFP